MQRWLRYCLLSFLSLHKLTVSYWSIASPSCEVHMPHLWLPCSCRKDYNAFRHSLGCIDMSMCLWHSVHRSRPLPETSSYKQLRSSHTGYACTYYSVVRSHLRICMSTPRCCKGILRGDTQDSCLKCNSLECIHNPQDAGTAVCRCIDVVLRKYSVDRVRSSSDLIGSHLRQGVHHHSVVGSCHACEDNRTTVL